MSPQIPLILRKNAKTAARKKVGPCAASLPERGIYSAATSKPNDAPTLPER